MEDGQKAITTTKPGVRTLDEVINGLDDESRKKLYFFIHRIEQINGNRLVLYDGQSVDLVFNLKSEISGVITRTIHTPQGPKEITRFMWDVNLNGRRKTWDLAPRWPINI